MVDVVMVAVIIKSKENPVFDLIQNTSGTHMIMSFCVAAFAFSLLSILTQHFPRIFVLVFTLPSDHSSPHAAAIITPTIHTIMHNKLKASHYHLHNKANNNMPVCGNPNHQQGLLLRPWHPQEVITIP